MSGQAVVIIKGKQWQVSLATSYPELIQGLSSIPQMPSGTGMLFDLGHDTMFTVTTEQMLFPIDIAFISDNLSVTETYRSIMPGYIVTSDVPARYFLEANAGELDDVEAGDGVAVQLLSPAHMPSQSDEIASFGAMLMALLAGVAIVIASTKGMMGDAHPLPETVVGQVTCEPVLPEHYELLRYFDKPVPDYSFSLEPEAKERRIDEVLRQLKAGVEDIQDSHSFREFLLTMSKFHDYSIGNLILIALQRKDATRVAGFNTWKDLGRWVKKGERGIAILAPCFPPKAQKTQTPETDEEKENGEKEKGQIVDVRPIYFKVVYVFDVSQTEGKELPQFEVPSLTGEANEDLFAGVMSLARSQGLDVAFEPRPQQDPSIKGVYFGKSIWVKPDESRAQQLKTLLHEVAHYYSEGVFRISRRDAETIAESVAFTVGARFGFDTGTRSFPYVALWSQDKKVLEQNLASIRKIATIMIEALEGKQASQLSMVK